MMELFLARRWFTDRATEGTLAIDGEPFCWTLEDRARGLRADMSLVELARLKVRGETAIPIGRYRVGLTPSDRARRGGLWSPRPDSMLPLVLDVPGYEGVRIHAGNRSRDTAGCPLIGFDRTQPADDWLGQSRPALIALMARIDAAERERVPVWLTIEEKPELDERTAATVIA